MENEVFETLAQILIDLELAPDMIEAKSVIIPASAARWLLPPKTARTASEGMKNPQMPADWTRAISIHGRTYFVNHKAKHTSWVHPWYQTPESLLRENRSDCPAPAYAPLPRPEVPLPTPSTSTSYPSSLRPGWTPPRDVYQCYPATDLVKAGPGSIYSTLTPHREEDNEQGQSQGFQRCASS